MSWRRELSKFGALLRRPKLADDLEAEIRSHLEMEERENLEAGMPPDEAHYAALRRFGNVILTEERSREMWGWNGAETLWQDVRYGLRQLRRSPAFAAVAVITLALGIGATTAIFSVVDTVLIRPLPYKDPGRLVWVTERAPMVQGAIVLSPDFAAWRDDSHLFQWLGAFKGGVGANLTGGGHPARVAVLTVTPEFFSMLGVRPILGRTFTSEDGKEGRGDVALLSEALWRSRFAADRHIIGRTIHLDGVLYTVVGVIPGNVRYPHSDVWRPLALKEDAFSPHSPVWLILTVVGRLKPGVKITQAQAELDVITHRMDREYGPAVRRDRAHLSVGVVRLHTLLVRNERPLLLILLGAVGFVLLIACANVANLSLARTAVRGKEIAVRAALGAGRLRLIRQLLTESLLLAAAGGLLGFLAGMWSVELLKRLVPPSLTSEISLDLRILAFVIGIEVITVILFGFVPALVASRLDLSEAIKEGGVRARAGQGTYRLRSLLVVGEIALSLVLLIGAGLLARSFVRLDEVPLGFNPHHVLLADVWRPIPHSPVADLHARLTQFFQEVLERVRALPGVEEASATSHYPLRTFSGISISKDLRVYGRETATTRQIEVTSISPGYFHAMDIRLMKGRAFDEGDVMGAPGVMILSESLARALFPRRDPIGQQVSLDGGPWKTVVGVVADTQNYTLAQQPWPEIFLPYPQQTSYFMTLLVRATGNPLALAGAVRNAVQSVDKNQAVSNIENMDEEIAKSIAPQRFRTLLLGLFALLALALAAIGIYGVMSYSVSQVTHEIGIRMALGAQQQTVLKLIVGQGFKLGLVGIAIGVASALGLTRFLSSLLYGVRPADPLTFAAVSLVLVSVALLACYIPARRATKVDPAVVLRHE